VLGPRTAGRNCGFRMSQTTVIALRALKPSASMMYCDKLPRVSKPGPGAGEGGFQELVERTESSGGEISNNYRACKKKRKKKKKKAALIKLGLSAH